MKEEQGLQDDKLGKNTLSVKVSDNRFRKKIKPGYYRGVKTQTSKSEKDKDFKDTAKSEARSFQGGPNRKFAKDRFTGKSETKVQENIFDIMKEAENIAQVERQQELQSSPKESGFDESKTLKGSKHGNTFKADESLLTGAKLIKKRDFINSTKPADSENNESPSSEETPQSTVLPSKKRTFPTYPTKEPMGNYVDSSKDAGNLQLYEGEDNYSVLKRNITVRALDNMLNNVLGTRDLFQNKIHKSEAGENTSTSNGPRQINAGIDSTGAETPELADKLMKVQRYGYSSNAPGLVSAASSANALREDPLSSNEKVDRRKGDKESKLEKEKFSKLDKTMRRAEGCLEIMPDGYGFLRVQNYNTGPDDVYIPAHMVSRFSLRKGDYIDGYCKAPKKSNKYDAMFRIVSINGIPADELPPRQDFEMLKAVYPDERYVLETPGGSISARIIDLLAPLGKGQRGLIVSPPKAGKTTILKDIAFAINQNYPDTHLIVLLIDERPEEVSDIQNSVKGEIIYSTFDCGPENHVKVSELVLERAQRLVETGQDVVILLDSITRMGRAYNLTVNSGGRTLSGGLDPAALQGPKRFFGSARKIENAGSLTIVATALVDTGSRLDDLIFEEFKGTGNMEVYLDRKLAEKRVFPAIELNKSGTRREDLLLNKDEIKAMWSLRRTMAGMDPVKIIRTIGNMLQKTGNNASFIRFILNQIK